MVDIDATTHRSKAHSNRPAGVRPDAIVFHTGEGDSAADDINALTKSKKKSSHYYVTRKGKIFQFVDDSQRANHAGPNLYLGSNNWNDFSIGMETEHNQKQDWPEVQLDAIRALLRHLIQKHEIIRERVAAHRWVREPSPEHQDPTGFTDPELRGFITRLYPEDARGELMRINTDGASVRRSASRAEDPIAKLNTGDVIEIEGRVQGEAVRGNRVWMKRVNDQGFVHSSLLDEVEIDFG